MEENIMRGDKFSIYQIRFLLGPKGIDRRPTSFYKKVVWLVESPVAFALAKIMLVCLMLFGSQSFSQPLATGHDKFLGNVVGGSAPANWDSYWNQVTPENAGKWGSVEGTRDSYSWGGADQSYNYAKQRGIPFKWHNLIWGQQQPSWISSLDSATQAEEIEEWIRLVGERYPEMDLVDVVNEPLPGHNPPDGRNGRANYMGALGGNGQTGYDWVIKCFELARKYCAPTAKLLVNEYGIINDDNATTQYLTLINLLKARNLVDGVGVQGHRGELEHASVSTLKANLDRLAATGLPIYISEFDVAPGNVVNDSTQLAEYKRIFPTLWEHPGVKGITLWGYIQGQIWQTAAYLVRSDGTERPALQWLRQYLTTGNYRSHASGNWNDVNSWEWNNGSAWVNPVPNPPTLAVGPIAVQSGDTITVSAADSADQLFIATGGALMINSGVTFHVKNGDGTDLSVNGTVTNSGVLTPEDSATIRFLNGGKCVHAQNGGSIPLATWGTGSACEITGYISGSKPDNLNQAFYNFTWDCSGQTSDVDWGWYNNTINGTITVKNTGSMSAYMTSPAAGTPNTINIIGGINVQGGQFSSNGSSSEADITVNTRGNVNVSGGDFSVSRGSGPTVTWNLFRNFSMSNATTQNSNPTGAKFVFAGPGTWTLTLGTGNTLTALPIEVSSGTTLNVGTSVLTGSGIFVLDPDATLAIAHAQGLDGAIQITGTKTLSKEANYKFSGTTAQITGNSLPDTVGNLTIDNTAGVTLSGRVVVNDTLDMKRGALSLGGNVLVYGANSTLTYSGSSARTTGETEFPLNGGPNNLSISNASGVTLHASRTIPGNLGLAGKLTLGSNTLTVGTATSTGPTRYVVTGTGALRLTSIGSSETLFPVGTTSYAPVWVTNVGTVDTVGLSVEADVVPAEYGGRVNVKWNISGTAGSGNYTLKFGWVSTLEDAAFRANRTQAHIFLLAGDTTEAGTGIYTAQFSTSPYSVSRGGILTLGTFAVGKFKNVEDIVGVERNKEAVPTQSSLSQNYPNPFNPTTTIQYSVLSTEYISLKVYDVLGRELSTLVSEVKPPGIYTVKWEAQGLASGIYFYRLEAGQFTETRKLVLLR
jgi:endo-1,4-beta-xylanase